ncbi:PAS domain-containing sensor histidine kinase [Sphingomonas alpina]|uniref:Sensor protein FixL n=1 Tax=Sphingomonas alpina TaxID=653931 RepID=A0A7H0LLP1_9SPHN|nr:PAS domain S-box protein [Sphingomonas alpina]QNQ10594.1 PAS domain S-box protein [Sphingomonas alpina]
MRICAIPLKPGTLAEELGLLIDGATNYAIYMLDPQGYVTIWNRGAERIKGWTQAEIVGRHFSVFYQPRDIAADKPAADLVRAAAEGRLEEESWRVRRDGSEFFACVTMTALHDETGALRGFGKVVRDLTEQKAAETALARREEHLRSILETVPDAMIIIDEAGTISSFSAAAERLFGHVEADVIGRNVSVLMPEPDRGRHDGYLADYMGGGERKVIGRVRLVTGLRRNGETFPLELAVGEALVGDRRIFTGFIRDLTERRRTELRLQDLQSELIHVSRLSAMGTMASTLAHELNQPLTAVTNYLEGARGLLDDPTPETLALAREAMEDATAQSIRAGHIIRRLRDFVAHGAVSQRPEPLNLMVEEAAHLALIGARAAGVRVVTDYSSTDAMVRADRVQIQQVLVNLIRNAIQAMADTPRRILTIATCPVDDHMQVTITDTGGGIAPGVADRLFQAFASSKPEGMGLGLSICRTIVEAHGGAIWATALPDGTEFHFTLLRADLDDIDGG